MKRNRHDISSESEYEPEESEDLGSETDSDSAMLDELIRRTTRSMTRNRSKPKPRPKKRVRKAPKGPLQPRPFEVKNWGDLIRLVNTVKGEERKYDKCYLLPDIHETLLKIDALIGMVDAKNQLAKTIILWLQPDLWAKRVTEMQHICITGPSGAGKTTLAKLLTQLYCDMGILQDNHIVKGDRTNMISQYVGNTARKTKKLIKKAIGGCLLIDEAYQLSDGVDSGNQGYAKACMDTLTQQLSERGNEFLCIVLGYDTEMKRDFFGANSGLERRFPLRFKVQLYKGAELRQIFITKLTEQKLALDPAAGPDDWWIQHESAFVHGGGSITTFVLMLWDVYALRQFNTTENDLVIQADLDHTLKRFKKHSPDDDRWRHQSMFL